MSLTSDIRHTYSELLAACESLRSKQHIYSEMVAASRCECSAHFIQNSIPTNSKCLTPHKLSQRLRFWLLTFDFAIEDNSSKLLIPPSRPPTHPPSLSHTHTLLSRAPPGPTPPSPAPLPPHSAAKSNPLNHLCRTNCAAHGGRMRLIPQLRRSICREHRTRPQLRQRGCSIVWSRHTVCQYAP